MYIPPANPDIKRELIKQLLTLPARSFEFFAGEFLVYVGLEAVSVTRYFGDGGIDAQGNLVAGLFRIPVGVQVKQKSISLAGCCSVKIDSANYKLFSKSSTCSDCSKVVIVSPGKWGTVSS
jgi:hypothetical protein